MNQEQKVHRVLLANGEMTAEAICKASGLAYPVVRDACGRLFRKRLISIVGHDRGFNVWASTGHYLVEDLRGESEASSAGRARGVQVMKERKRERAQTIGETV